jgi:hypothetical protein
MKKIATIILVVILSLAFTTTASANTPLGSITWNHEPPFQGWRSNGADDVSTSLSWEALSTATGIAVVVDRDLEGGEIRLVLQSSGNDWAWASHTYTGLEGKMAFAEGGGGTLTLMFSEHPGWREFASGGPGKIALGYWGDGSGTFANLGMVSATLIGGSGGGGGGGGQQAPRTGVVAFIGIAAAALVVSGGGAVFVARKLKK